MSAEALEKIVSFTRRTTALTADHVRQAAGAWIFSTPSIEVAWGLNHVRLTAPTSFTDATSLADRAQAGLDYRRVTLEPGALTPALEEAFTAAGWRAEHDLLMALSRPPDRVVDTGRVIETAEAEHLKLGRMWSAEEHPETSADVLAALTRFWHRESEVFGDCFLGVADPDGEGILAKAKLRSDGDVAQVEDVYTIPRARGRGHGRALVTRAVELARQAGHELTFIIADDDDWPKRLYEQIGFAPVGRIVHFHRDVAVSPPAPQMPVRTAMQSS